MELKKQTNKQGFKNMNLSAFIFLTMLLISCLRVVLTPFGFAALRFQSFVNAECEPRPYRPTIYRR